MSAIPPGSFADLAAAKINLYLRVLGKRKDGYHRLDSLVGFAEIGDRLSVTPAGELSLSFSGPFAAALREMPMEENLVLRAAAALRHAANQPGLGAALHLEKHLPIAAGIGGGSADAAATLRLLINFWRLNAEGLPLGQIASCLGADVPICLLGQSARLGGIGEELLPIRLPRAPLVLVNPGVLLATKTIFAERTGDFSLPLFALPDLTNVQTLAELVQRGGNDLLRPALSHAPAIGEILKALRAAPGCLAAALSGSGATCFGLFATRDSRTEAAARIKTAYPSWWVAGTWLG